MMERMGYILTKGSGLNFGKGKRALLRPFIQKGKDPDYYHKTQRGLSYVSMLVSLDFESKEEVYHDSSSATSSWDSDVNIGGIFESLSVKIVSANYLKDDEENTIESEELMQLDSDPWIKHLNTFWDVRFEQHEPPTENKVTQINPENEVNPKLIFISESLSLP